MAQQHASLLHHRPRPHRPGMSFAVVNGLTFGLHLLLACSAADFMATRVWGETTIGVLALLIQGSLLLWTAARYDRRADERGAAREQELEH
ncbi:hypothetical protein SLUN_25085 [Streptomyces lunaelactis]|uniref:DUF485 domain-containing protein n=2 Tax=Streptomyces lunaelactis TaxID=1535768 RepID=A0A2R4T760_9ACTN|nr:hypothetical protein SLUN_25085 [Streptomyces lunaelactis]NUK23399.1 hypothetical protein [Streptomyces lunaelactis]NUK85247.1 hypothetical protein [Streptomyces lunaelactis]